MKPSIGRIVHFVQKKPQSSVAPLVHLPAIITAVWGPDCVNLQVFCDGGNSEEQNNGTSQPANVKWITSVNQDPSGETPRSWHWPEQV